MKVLLKQKLKSIQTWSIRPEYSQGGYTVTHGSVDGKKTDKFRTVKPKNIGKANETTLREQIDAEIYARYNKQITNECYVKVLGDTPHHIEPQLALDATKVPHRIPWEKGEMIASRKMDGVRAIWDWTKGKFISRKGTPYNVPRLEIAMIEAGVTNNLDGELYIHGVNLGDLVGSARTVGGQYNDQLEFHVFDVVMAEVSYKLRLNCLQCLAPMDGIVIVKHNPITPETLKSVHDHYVSEGYEGVMLRDATAPYAVGERTTSLFKYKEFMSEEFTIVDVVPDNNGTQGLLVVQVGDKTVTVRMKGTDKYRQELLADKDSLIGDSATVRFFGYTPDGLLQFPVGVAIADVK